MKIPADLTAFINEVKARLPGVRVGIDAPDDPAGEWWLDLQCGKFRSAVAWRAGRGFGIHTTAGGFGERPDEVYRRTMLAAQRIEQLWAHWRRSKTIVPLWLPEVRSLMGAAQTTLAAALACNQPAVSRFEQREDVKLSTLAAYVQAMGGRLEVRVCFPDWDAVIALPAVPG
jgi:hypothetical protein